MFGFGEVRTHLGVVFNDAFGLFEVFGWISEKMDEIRKIWAISGVLHRGVGTLCSSLGPRQGVACPRRNVAKRRLGQASGTPQQSTVHSMEIVVFCFVLFFRYSEDLSIGLIRAL